MKRLLALYTFLLAVTLVVAACGSSPKVLDHHACSAKDATMQCQLPAPPKQGVTVRVPTARGVDFAWGGPSVATMRANGWSFGASYLSFDYSKNFSPALINAYHAAGIHTVLVWETGSTRATEGYGAGRSDAFSAIQQANARGYWRVIYFAIDCDCAGVSVQSYFDGVRSVLPVKEIGAYGGYFPIHYLFNTGRIGYAWQTYAWSNGFWDPRAQLQQWLNGSSVDYDRSYVSDYGQVPFANPVPPRTRCFGPHAKLKLHSCQVIRVRVHHTEAALHHLQFHTAFNVGCFRKYPTKKNGHYVRWGPNYHRSFCTRVFATERADTAYIAANKY